MKQLDHSQDARSAALVLLGQILDRKQPLDLVFDTDTFRALDPRDRAFIHRLTAITLRRLGQCDCIIDALLDRPLPQRPRHLRHTLRLGVTQLLFADVPAYAAVDATVRLARTAGLAPYIKLVNAVLRRVDRLSCELLQRFPAVPTNTPPWLWHRWERNFGREEAARIAEQHLATPPLDLTPRRDAAVWAERLDGRLLPTGSIRLATAGRVQDIAGYDTGGWWVQDTAAALPTRLLGNVNGARVLDLCAAPGGKTAQLAAAGAAVTAVDKAASRLKTLRENLRRLRLDADCLVGDATTYTPAGPQTRILLDAPCTATGTIRRNPDIPWTRRTADIEMAAGRQAKLLQAALGMLAPGGTLVYAVCSLEPEEGVAQIENVLRHDARVDRIPIAPREIGALDQCITPAGDLRTLPCHLSEVGGMDGFFAARLRRW